MNGQPNSQPPKRALRHPPGVPILEGVNWAGLGTLYIKEVRRFFKVQLQTVWAPSITTLLFLAIFTVALGREGRTVMGVPFADFLAPGLIIMAMLQNAFANASFSFLSGKMQGTIVDFLMPPLSEGELMLAMIVGAVTRAISTWVSLVLVPPVASTVSRPSATGTVSVACRYSAVAVEVNRSIAVTPSTRTVCTHLIRTTFC